MAKVFAADFASPDSARELAIGLELEHEQLELAPASTGIAVDSRHSQSSHADVDCAVIDVSQELGKRSKARVATLARRSCFSSKHTVQCSKSSSSGCRTASTSDSVPHTSMT